MSANRTPLPDRIPIEEIEAAQERLRGLAERTPLVRLEVELPDTEIWLKLENLQPIGSFKLRGSGNAIAAADPEALRAGVYTASAGNMAQGLAWNARRLGIPCQVVVPDHAPKTKLAATERLGATSIPVPFDDWWRVIEEHRFPGLEGFFVHPVCNREVIAGNGTIGLEILEDLPDPDAVVVPYGGGGLSCGIGSALRARRPATRVFAAESAVAAPLAAALQAGTPTAVNYRRSFVDGIGGKAVLDEMWSLARGLIHDSLVVDLDAIASAIRLLVERHRVVAEGAGAASVAAALAGLAGRGRIVCVVSGGNIDAGVLSEILAGRVPAPN